WRLHTRTGRCCNNVALHRPGEHFAHSGQCAVGCDGSLNDNLIKQANYIAATDVADQSPAPMRQGVPPKCTLCRFCCSSSVQPSDMTVEKLVHYRVEAINAGRAGLNFFTPWIPPLGNGSQCFGCEFAGVL